MRFFYDPLGVLRDLLYGLLLAIGPAWLADLIMAALAVGIVVAVVPVLVMSAIWLERRIIAKMQDRIGPNRVGPIGLLQPVADALKLLSKEDVIPARVDKPLFILAPVVVLGASLMIWATIPWGPGLAPTDLNVGVLFLLAMGGLPALGVIMAAWGSYNKYALIGGMRAAAQLISYEIPGVLGALVPVMLAGSMSLQEIVRAQEGFRWFLFYFPVGPLAFLLYLIAGVAETNRTPFDLIEAESELAAGFHTEYSGMRFALFFLAEYANVFAISAIGTVLFLGGWSLPGLDALPIPTFVWFLAKVYALVFVFIWIRSTLPRFRYDQLMHFAWKRMLPLALLNVGAAGVWISVARGFAR
jgi:NADH-quinone oxidoreductase subunit H